MDVRINLVTTSRNIDGIESTPWERFGLEIDWITIFCPNHATFSSWLQSLERDLPSLKVYDVKTKRALHGEKYGVHYPDFEVWTYVDNLEYRTHYYIRMSNKTCVYFFANLYAHSTYASLRAASSLKRIDVKMVYTYSYQIDRSQQEIQELQGKLASDVYESQTFLESCTRFKNSVKFIKSPEGFTVTRGFRDVDHYFFRVCVFPERMYYELEIKKQPIFALSRLWRLNDIDQFLYSLISIYQKQGKKIAQTAETQNYRYDVEFLRFFLLPLAAKFDKKKALAIEREEFKKILPTMQTNFKVAHKAKYVYCSPFVFIPMRTQQKKTPIEIIVALYSLFLVQKVFHCSTTEFSEKLVVLNFFWYELDSEIFPESFFTFSVTAKELCKFLGWEARTRNIKKIISCLTDLEDWDSNYPCPEDYIHFDFFIKNLSITREYKMGYTFSMTFHRDVFKHLLWGGFIIPINLISRFSAFYRQKKLKGRIPSTLYSTLFYVLRQSVAAIDGPLSLFALDVEYLQNLRIQNRKIEVLQLSLVLEFLIKNQIFIGFEFEGSNEVFCSLNYKDFSLKLQREKLIKNIFIYVSFESRNYSEYFLGRLAELEGRHK